MSVKDFIFGGLLFKPRKADRHAYFTAGLLSRAKHYAIALMLAIGLGVFAAPSFANIAPDDLLSDDGQPLNYEPIPLLRPDVAISYGGEVVDIATPFARPTIAEAFGASTATLSEMILRETTSRAASESLFALQSGETLSKIMSRAGFSRKIGANVINILAKRVNVRRLQIGMSFTVAYDSDEQPIGLHFKDKENFDHYILFDSQMAWFGFRTVRPEERYLVYASGKIDGTIYEAVDSQNVPYAALDEFVRVLGFSVDFQREIRSGDEFELLYERRIDKLTGEDLGSGTLHYAGLNLSGDVMSFFRYEADNIVGWYDREGNSAVRSLMRTPISGAPISSKYGMRRHPITGYNAMHRGVDFQAPTGTPILAAGSGVVQRANWFGNYGRYIRIRHTGRYSTAYAHMTRIASGITPGARVRQGQIIGYVGSTGRSTGPHLHYEVLVNNKQVNPMTVKLPSGEALEAEHLSRFQDIVQTVEAEVESRGQVLFASSAQ